MDIPGAFADLKAGKLGAVLALGSQAQAAMGKEKGFCRRVGPAPGRVPPGWAFGLAVKSEQEQLAQALKKAMVEVGAGWNPRRDFRAHNVTASAPREADDPGRSVLPALGVGFSSWGRAGGVDSRSVMPPFHALDRFQCSGS